MNIYHLCRILDNNIIAAIRNEAVRTCAVVLRITLIGHMPVIERFRIGPNGTDYRSTGVKFVVDCWTSPIFNKRTGGDIAWPQLVFLRENSHRNVCAS